MKILRPSCDARISVTFYYMSILGISFLLSISKLVSRVGCDKESKERQSEAWLMIPPLKYYPLDASDTVEIVDLITVSSLC